MNEHEKSDPKLNKTRRNLVMATSVVGGAAAVGAAVPFVVSLWPSERARAAGAPVEDQPGAIAILHIGGMDNDVQEKAERVDQNMSLAARDLFARIKALRVERGAPF